MFSGYEPRYKETEELTAALSSQFMLSEDMNTFILDLRPCKHRILPSFHLPVGVWWIMKEVPAVCLQ